MSDVDTSVPRPSGTAAPEFGHQTDSAVFVEREEHLTGLRSAVAGHRPGTAGAVLVEGGVGCGKSTFLSAAVRHLTASGSLVLRAGSAGPGSSSPDLLGQLLRNRSFPDDLRTGLEQTLDGNLPLVPVAGHSATAACERPDKNGRLAQARNLCAVFQAIARTSHLVIAVDDLHGVDDATRQYLLHTVRDSPSGSVLLICTTNPCVRKDAPLLDADFLSLPRFHRIVLNPLTRNGIAEYLATSLGQPVGDDLVDHYHAVTGGNPLLLRSLLEEARESVGCRTGTEPGRCTEGPVQPVVGGPFYRAALACLARIGAVSRESAAALAVLGGAGSPGRLAHVVQQNTAAAAWDLRLLGLTGLTDDAGRLRHPVLAAAALDTLPHDHRTALHRRTAKLLYDEGAPALDIAGHLLAVGHGEDRWAVSVLCDAAEEILAGDDAKQATACLELAERMSGNARQRAVIGIRLAQIAWRINHAAASQRLAELVTDMEEGRLSAPHTALLARLLIARGRLGEAGTALARLPGRGGTAGPAPGDPCDFSALWASAEYPVPLARAARFVPQEPGGAVQAAAGEVPELKAAAAVWAWPGDGTSDSAAEAAAHALRHSPITDTTLVLLTNAVRTLARAGRCDTAVFWCNRLLGEARRRDAQGWHTELTAVQAEISLMLGILRDAGQQAEAALTAVPQGTESVFVGSPLATLIMVHTAMGRYDDALEKVNHPVSEGLFHSVYGLGFMRARGHFHLATNRLLAAVSDFTNAGRIAECWGLDRAEILPWRNDAAQAFLRLGDGAKARQLVREQMAQSRGSSAQVRGAMLRICARTVGGADRIRLLDEAADALRASGDRLELARALADLGRTHQAEGDTVRAGTLIRRAWRLAEECGAKALCDQIIPGGGDGEYTGKPRGRLSESEMRVAVLAAHGNTNKEIAAKLYVTVSTVEQHLTKVFRKLDITRRQQLRARLQEELRGPVP
ncbi:AAA family ATPase [Streptomyces sp. AV19]|uniref:AAA family ATPase n=1 Tax=Streptomyces sp. AV19 TaxID=2793068 RepID=UPI0018FE6143|nr:LuxR family transcriptional regulator [Streptomyces sp. AV19]MBH1938898.1 AAA family ATPase [Streptomyces sp. AV19]MDG4533626.1 AAA family ATPase [Streptomyces sp. AV19]